MRCNIWSLSLIAAATGLCSCMRVMGEQQSRHSTDQVSIVQSTQPIPPYHNSAKEARPLPRLLPASVFTDRPLVARAYQIANEIPSVLAQQPCYCHCDKTFGHTSLLSCFTSSHTAGCGICMAETFFAFQMTKQGKTPAQIRHGIIRGDWKQPTIVKGPK